MSRAAFAQKTHERDVDAYKEWLCDNTPINVVQGLYEILSNNNSCGLLQQLQISHLKSQLIGKMMFAGISVAVEYGVVTVDDIITIEGDFNRPDVLDYYIRSRSQFVKLIYQYMSCFPGALYDAYKEIIGESLILDDLSEVREFYEECSTFDSWTESVQLTVSEVKH